jgi:hypothetical protein
VNEVRAVPPVRLTPEVVEPIERWLNGDEEREVFLGTSKEKEPLPFCPGVGAQRLGVHWSYSKDLAATLRREVEHTEAFYRAFEKGDGE